ncbi:aldo/keto reductase [Pelagibacterium xiamenense]|uniref:aldo/keto reductase n=1 Tax=Pelagibacterium xiamenense TaxID=2901140 RepID=UPI001E4AE53A|nr:aldo/keto reductase [Pelagibacterium xiamenense]MCD7058322.1 aldo/keto reductase [Pelagibacterium xiamenense]
MTQAPKIRWGILGPGNIAKAFAGGVLHSETGELAAIATRNPGRAGLADAFPGARIVDGYHALLDDPEIDAVYIAVPHPYHAQWGIRAAEVGKHVLCEKPMGLSAFEADAMFHAALKAGTFMGEAYMYRLHPQTKKIVDLVTSGAIGEVRMIKSSFGFAMPKFDPEHRLYANDLAGGGILDVGGYPVSMARLIAGAVDGKGVSEPVEVSGSGHLGQSGVDEWASAVLKFENGIVAEVSCSVSLNQDNVLRILGTTGRIEVKDFWFASGHEGGTGLIEIVRPDGSRETVEVKEDRWLYSFEVDAAGEAIRAGKTEFAYPGMTRADSLANLRVMDKWRASIGLEYEIEKPNLRTATIKGEPLEKRSDAIKRHKIPGLERPISKVAIGFEDFRSFSSVSILLDAFYEKGGNAFDTGFIYGGGITETLLGDWHTSRGVREDMVIIGKGAHSPLCYPDVIAKQLDVTLDRLKTDYVDVYFMHRDNLDIPVGEFVDAMDAEVQKGRIRGPFGGSNWTRERFDEAVAYARKTGKTAPGVLSNNFSLAEMQKPLWPGCIASSDAEWRTWLEERQIPNFAWSSQGRGFFTERAGRDKTDSVELVETWYTEENFGRRDRAIEMAEKLGKHPIHIALAYCFYQPFPVVPLIGPRTLWELDSSLEALEIELTPEDIAWLQTGKR